jgi:hypothetical protein
VTGGVLILGREVEIVSPKVIFLKKTRFQIKQFVWVLQMILDEEL